MKLSFRDVIDNLLEKIYVFVSNEKTILNLSVGYIFSFMATILDDILDKSTPINIYEYFIDVSAKMILLYLSIFIVLLYTILSAILKKYFKNNSSNKRFLKILNTYNSNLFENNKEEGYGWGSNKTFVCCPYVQKGLKVEDVIFEFRNVMYDFSELLRMDNSFLGRNLDEEYNSYLNNEFFINYTMDSDRLMIINKPSIYTDDNKIRICVKKVKWSQLRFFWDKLLISDEQRKRYIDFYYTNLDIYSPNSFCLHLVIMTSDNKVFITCNAPNKPGDYPGSWAVSIGEQLDWEDIKESTGNCAYFWVKRALIEELYLQDSDFLSDSIRYISINLEGNICNFAYVCIVNIKLSLSELTDHLNSIQRLDNEFKKFDFLGINDIPNELLNPSKEYHPSSGIRLLYAFLHQKGREQLKFELLKKNV